MSDLEPLLSLVRPEIRALAAYKTPTNALPIKLDANESPFGLPREVMADLAEVTRELALHRYPDLEVGALREALAAWLGTSPRRLVVGVGSDESIGVLLTAIARPRDREAPVVVLPEPTFVMYAQTARVLGVEPVGVPLLGDDFALDPAGIIETVHARRAALAFLASPNNPTGVAYADADLLAIARACPHTLVVVDEAYGAFRPRDGSGARTSHRSALLGAAGAPNLLFLGTLSKIGLASLRIGWVEAPEPLALELDKVRLPYDMPGPSQALGARVLTQHRAALEACIDRIVLERDRLARLLADAHAAGGPLRPIPSVANFFLCEARSTETARAVHAHLLRAGIQVRAFRDPRLARHLRITVGRPEHDEALVRALADFAPGTEAP